MPSYASLDEVFPDWNKQGDSTEDDNMYKDITNNIVDYNKTDQVAAQYRSDIENFENYKNFEDSDSDSDDDWQENEIEEFENDQAEDKNCSKFLYHLSVCKKCRGFAKQKFGSERIIETKKTKRDEFLDIAIYIITGIFILFLLDILVKIKK